MRRRCCWKNAIAIKCCYQAFTFLYTFRLLKFPSTSWVWDKKGASDVREKTIFIYNDRIYGSGVN